MKTIRTAVAYTRVSSKDQDREGFSIPAQQRLLREYARSQGFTVVREFVDIETAKQTGRAGFGEMLAFLRLNPDCTTILVEKTDRLYRNIRDWVTIDDLHIVVHFVKEATVVSADSRSSDKFMHGIKVLMAKNYVDNLSEEVKKGMREKAQQGQWPSVAPIGYVNNLSTHRIEPDAVRAPLIADVFHLYATGDYSLKALVAQVRTIGLTYPRGNRPLRKSDVHRILQNPIYFGEFVWLGQRYEGVHDAIIDRETFDQVQAVLRRRPRARYPKQRHPFMGLVTCGRCGCAMTAECKKGKYVYYHCTNFHGDCENTYIRQERLGDLLADVIRPIQISQAIADDIATAIQSSDHDAERHRSDTLRQLDERRRGILSKLDRGYEDFIEGRISDEFWTRRSQAWEADLQLIDAERSRVGAPRPNMLVTAVKILELAKQAEFLYKQQKPEAQRRLLETVLSNCAFDRGSLSVTYVKPFDLLVRGNETGEWRGRRDSNPRPLP
jgi:site-specific DNA recombinase